MHKTNDLEEGTQQAVGPLEIERGDPHAGGLEGHRSIA